MNTMEMTKLVGAVCGSLLVFLLIQTVAHGLFHTHSEEVAYSIVVEGGEGEETAPEEDVDVGALVAAADPAKGEAVFKKCTACHKIDGADGVGPHLNGVVERDIASVEGFKYSDALAALEGTWTPDQIFHFIASPKAFAPGTAMNFAGLPKPEDRANVIAYLASVSG